MRIKIIVDRDACQSIASCVSTSPEIYALDEEAKAAVVGIRGQKENPNKMVYEFDADDNTAQKAVLGAETCPYLAIEVHNADTNQKLFPRGE